MTLPRPAPASSRSSGVRIGVAAGVVVVVVVAVVVALGAGAWMRGGQHAAGPPAPAPEAPDTMAPAAGAAASAASPAPAQEVDSPVSAPGSAPVATPLAPASTSAATKSAPPRPAPAPDRVSSLRAYTEPSAMPGPAAMRAMHGRSDAAGAVGANAAGSSPDAGAAVHALLATVVFATDSDQLPPDAAAVLQAALQASASSGAHAVTVVPLYDIDGGTPLGLAQRRGANVQQALIREAGDSRRVLLQDARPAAASAGLVGGRTVELRAGP